MKRITITLLTLSIVFTLKGQALTIYLSPSGNDADKGEASSPVQTIGGAKIIIREAFIDNAYSEVILLLEEGIYTQKEQLVFDKDLFKGNDVKFHIKSKGKNKAIISGGLQIPTSKFIKLNTDKIDRFHEKAKGNVYVADLKNTPMANYFSVFDAHNSSGSQLSSSKTLLTWGKYNLELARWPNRGYCHIDSVYSRGPWTRLLKPGEQPPAYSFDNPSGGEFSIVEQSNWDKWEAEFKPNGQVFLEGYLHNDWYFQSDAIGSIDKGKIKLLKHNRYGIESKTSMIPRRIRVVNLLCELDQPGEWYFDIESKKLYLWPPEEFNTSTNISVAGGETMLKFEKLNNVTIENLIFQNGGDLAIAIKGGENNTIGGCTFRNFVSKGVSIYGGKSNGIIGCDFYGLRGAASLSGGDRTTLVPCKNYMINCHIYNCRERGYGVVSLSGVGLRFANNLLHDMNGAVSFSGNDIVIEFNEYYNMGWEMGDWNVTYTGADWASFGNKVQYNFVHHLMEMPGAYAVEAFRNDDLGMGVEFFGNVFYKSGRGCVAFSGAGNNCVNNIAIKTKKVWEAFYAVKNEAQIREKWEYKRKYDDGELVRGDKDDNLWRAEQCYGKMGWLFDPYKTKYPLLKEIMNGGNPFSTSFGIIKYNYIDKKDAKSGINMHGCTVDDLPATTEWEYPKHIDMKSFENPSVLNFQIKKDYKLMEGFEEIPFDKIGLIKDEYRKSVPDKNKYRKDIMKRFEGVPSSGGRYKINEVSTRYPLPLYLK